MKRLIFLNLLLLPSIQGKSTITYQLNAGRFGDRLRIALQALWYADIYNLRLLYQEFEFTNKLAMHDLCEHTININSRNYRNRVRVNNKSDIEKHIADDNILFISHFFSEVPPLHLEVIRNKRFGDRVKQLLQPRIFLQSSNKFNLVEVPKEIISVALHVRKGGGFDRALASKQFFTSNSPYEEPYLPDEHYADLGHAEKFPPDQFYVDQLVSFSELLGDPPLFVFLFTDYQRPAELLEQYKQAINKDNITLACRPGPGGHRVNVLDDFFSIGLFDVLIHPESSFSETARLRGDHKIIIYLKKAHWEIDRLLADDVQIVFWDREHQDAHEMFFDKNNSCVKENILKYLHY